MCSQTKVQDTADDVNPACPHIYYTTILPRVSGGKLHAGFTPSTIAHRSSEKTTAAVLAFLWLLVDDANQGIRHLDRPRKALRTAQLLRRA